MRIIEIVLFKIASIRVHIEKCCGYRVIRGLVLLRLQSTNYGGLYEYKYDYKNTIEVMRLQ